MLLPHHCCRPTPPVDIHNQSLNPSLNSSNISLVQNKRSVNGCKPLRRLCQFYAVFAEWHHPQNKVTFRLDQILPFLKISGKSFSVIFTRDSRMLLASWSSSRRTSVCPSVTLRYCVKTTQARMTRSSLWAVGCTKDFSLSRQNFVPVGDRVPLERERQRGVPSIKTLFCRYWLV